MRKPVLRVSDQVRHKPQNMARGLKISDLGRRGIVLSMKTKALICCMAIMQLICTFVFAYVKSRFSHDVSHIMHYIEHYNDLQNWCKQ